VAQQTLRIRNGGGIGAPLFVAVDELFQCLNKACG
jgi:hypothetical protein